MKEQNIRKIVAEELGEVIRRIGVYCGALLLIIATATVVEFMLLMDYLQLAELSRVGIFHATYIPGYSTYGSGVIIGMLTVLGVYIWAIHKLKKVVWYE